MKTAIALVLVLGDSQSIGPDTIPGTVALPTWVLVAAIVALFGVREVERRSWFAKMAASTEALNRNTDLIEKLTGAVARWKWRK